MRARAWRTLGRFSNYRRSGTLAMLAGGALVARAVRSGRRGRAVTQGVLGAGLVALGLRQRLSSDGPATGTTGPIQFEEQDDEPAGESTTTEDPVQDPRSEEGRGDHVDVSDSATAAEPAEATGPTAEQRMPTQTDDTESEASESGGSERSRESEEPASGIASSGEDAEDDQSGPGSDEESGSASQAESGIGAGTDDEDFAVGGDDAARCAPDDDTETDDDAETDEDDSA